MLDGTEFKLNPVRIFEKCTHGGLGKGNLGAFMARAGVGKTACIIQLALDYLFNGKSVLHISIGQRVEEVRNWYDEMLENLFQAHHLTQIYHIRGEIEPRRMIHSYPDKACDIDRIIKQIERFKTEGSFKPDIVFIDGYPFDSITSEDLKKIKLIAQENGLEIWFTVQTHREGVIVNERGIPSPCHKIDDILSVIVFLEPLKDSVRLRLLKDHDNPYLLDLHLLLDSKTLLIKDETLQ